MTRNTVNETARMVVTRVFDAPRELVWKAWTDPQYVMLWWGPKGFTCPFCTMDFRVGGKYLFCMKTPDGQELWSGGEYHEIVSLREDRIHHVLFRSKWKSSGASTLRHRTRGDRRRMRRDDLGGFRQWPDQADLHWQRDHGERNQQRSSRGPERFARQGRCSGRKSSAGPMNVKALRLNVRISSRLRES